MSNTENASLVLKTGDVNLTAGGSANIGTANTINTSFTWYNINMRTLLGPMYDKYDTFNLCLSSISTGLAGPTAGATLYDRAVVINVAGLPFLYNTYDTKTKTNLQSAVMGTFTFIASQTISQYFYSANVATFGKNQDVCNISIYYTKVAPAVAGSGDYTVNSASSFPDVVFIFDIFGIDKEKGNHNGEHIKTTSFHY